MCITSISNTVFPCKICNTNIKDTDSAAQCDISQFGIHTKCNNLNHIDYKYLQGSSDPWFCISCCNEIFPFGILTNKKTSYLRLQTVIPLLLKIVMLIISVVVVL